VTGWELAQLLWLAVSMFCVILAALKTRGWLAPVFVAIVALLVGYVTGVIA
jgi:hypothetical protein